MPSIDVDVLICRLFDLVADAIKIRLFSQGGELVWAMVYRVSHKDRNAQSSLSDNPAKVFVLGLCQDLPIDEQ